MEATKITSRPVDEAADTASRASGNNKLFDDAPPARLQRRLGLENPDRPNFARRMLLIVLIGWAPLVLLTLAANIMQGSEAIVSLIREAGVHARYLVAAPLLVLAERECVPQLDATIRKFEESGLVPEHKRNEFAYAVASTRRSIKAKAAEIASFILSYLIVASAIWSPPASDIPVWHKAANAYFSPAGWWHVLVSMPLLVVLILGWMWRLVLWTRLLWLVSKLDLRLVFSHPDRAAGLGFDGYSVRAFSIVAFALATIAAGRSAHLVLEGSGLPTAQFHFNIGFIVAVVLLFTVPLLAFTSTLVEARRRGAANFGALAARVGGAFEDRWLKRDFADAREPPYEQPDFSTLSNLASVTSSVYSIRLVPLDRYSLVTLGCATLLPFTPVILLAVPMDVIWKSIQKLLL